MQQEENSSLAVLVALLVRLRDLKSSRLLCFLSVAARHVMGLLELPLSIRTGLFKGLEETACTRKGSGI